MPETPHSPPARAHVGQGTPYMKYAAPPYPTPSKLLTVMWVLNPAMIVEIVEGYWRRSFKGFLKLMERSIHWSCGR